MKNIRLKILHPQIDPVGPLVLLRLLFDECDYVRSLKHLERRCNLTKNQIEYWNLQEQKANNVRVWRENVRHNLATEVESKRSNLERENQNRLNWIQQGTKNDRDYYIQRRNLVENERSARARETENERSNRANEQIGLMNANSQRISALSNSRYQNAMSSASLGNMHANMLNALNANRQTSNAYTLGLRSARMQEAQLQETRRLNTLNNTIAQERNYIARQSNLNQAKSNMLTYQSKLDQLALDAQRLEETKRANRVQEDLKAYSIVGSFIGNTLRVGRSKG